MMEFSLTVHRELPTTHPAATHKLTGDTEAAVEFLHEALDRMTASIGEGESRSIGIGVTVTG